MLGFYNYTVILTYLGMFAGFSGILFASNGHLHSALICLIIAGICDMFDGKIASTMERTRAEKRFGVQIDSMSDLICFGVLPAVVVYAACAGSHLSHFAAAVYLLCALIRLAWFNVDEEERQEHAETRRRVYLGLPVTFVALIFPVFTFLCEQTALHGERILPAVTLATAAAFLTPFRLRKPAFLCGHPAAAEDDPEADEEADWEL